MSACAHNYVLINVSICFGENFAEMFRRNISPKRFAEIFAESFAEI